MNRNALFKLTITCKLIRMPYLASVIMLSMGTWCQFNKTFTSVAIVSEPVKNNSYTCVQVQVYKCKSFKKLTPVLRRHPVLSSGH